MLTHQKKVQGMVGAYCAHDIKRGEAFIDLRERWCVGNEIFGFICRYALHSRRKDFGYEVINFCLDVQWFLVIDFFPTAREYLVQQPVILVIECHLPDLKRGFAA